MFKFGSVLTLALLASTIARADDINIGAAAPLSGPQAVFGLTLHNGMKLYFDELNAKGGIDGKKLVLVQEDDKADPKEGTLVAQKMCDDSSVVSMLGHLNSGVQLAAMSVYGDCGMPQIVLGSNPTITQQGATHIVRATASDMAQGGVAASYVFDKLNAKSAAIVHDKQAFGQGVAEIFKAEFETKGGKITSVSGVNPTDVDFTALIAQIKNQNPDVVYVGAVMPQLSLFAKQLHEQGVKAQLVEPDGAYAPDFIEQAGADATKGVLVSFPIPPADATPELVAFGTRYKEKFGEEVGPYSVYGYAAAQIIAEAIKNAKGSTRDVILPALKAIDMTTVLGHVAFTDEGEMTTAPMFLYRVDGDKFDLVAKNE